MRERKSRAARGFLRMMIGIVMLFAALNCPRLVSHAETETISVKVRGDAFYGTEKLMIEEINQLRAQNGVPALTLDADLQEWAMQMSAEALFYTPIAGSSLRPNGTYANSSLFTKPVADMAIVPGRLQATTNDETVKVGMSRMYTYDKTEITTSRDYTSIGIGIYKDKSDAWGTTYGVILLGNGNINKGSYKSTVLNETRTINTLPSYFKLCNGGERVFSVGGASDKITFKGNETFTISIFQHSSDTSHMALEGTQIAWFIKDPTIASVIPTPEGVRVTGLKSGTTTFTGSLYGQTVTYSVTVTGEEGEDTAADVPSVKSLKDLPKSYKGEAVVGGKKLYIENRKKVTGEREVGGTIYYFKNGEKFTGTKGTYYYKDGVKYTGWLKKGGKKYYYAKGRMVKNRRMTIKKKKYYFNKKGVMQKNKWVKIGKYKYFFNKKGVQTKKKKA